jgi:hypothetical protein
MSLYTPPVRKRDVPTEDMLFVGVAQCPQCGAIVARIDNISVKEKDHFEKLAPSHAGCVLDTVVFWEASETNGRRA